eukprot:754846-Hanusia_phi.AAC.1
MCEKLMRGEPGTEVSLVVPALLVSVLAKSRQVLPRATKRRLEYEDVELDDLVEVRRGGEEIDRWVRGERRRAEKKNEGGGQGGVSQACKRRSSRKR